MARPAHPAALNKLNGNPGKRSVAVTEIDFPPGTPEPPAELPPRAASHWRYAVSMMEYVPGMLTQADRDVLFLYAMTWETFYSAQDEIEQNGLIATSEKGAPYMNPAVGIQNTAKKMILQIAQQWGFTPVSRAGKQLGTGPEKEEDPFTKLLKQRGVSN